MKSLIVLGTGESLIRYKDKLKSLMNNCHTLSWGASFDFCIDEIGTTPTYFSFIDPTSAIRPIKLIKQNNIQDTTILLLSPVVNKSLKVFQTYMEKTSGPARSNFEKYLTDLNTACRISNSQEIPCITLKGLHLTKDPLAKKDLDNTDASLRFEGKRLICGMKNNLGLGIHKPGSRYMNLYETKLTMFILPICFWLGYEDIYFVGCDGGGGRFFNKRLTDIKLIKTIDEFFPVWIKWKVYHKMNFFSLVEDRFSILNKYIPKQEP